MGGAGRLWGLGGHCCPNTMFRRHHGGTLPLASGTPSAPTSQPGAPLSQTCGTCSGGEPCRPQERRPQPQCERWPKTPFYFMLGPKAWECLSQGLARLEHHPHPASSPSLVQTHKASPRVRILLQVDVKLPGPCLPGSWVRRLGCWRGGVCRQGPGKCGVRASGR